MATMMEIMLRMCTAPSCPKCAGRMEFDRVEGYGYTGTLRLVCSCGQAGQPHEFPMYNASFPQLSGIIHEVMKDKGDVHD